MQVQVDARMLGAECADHLRKNIARLGMGRADRQRADLAILYVVRYPLDAVHLAQHAQRVRNHSLPSLGDAGERTSLAHEEVEAELVLQQLELLADGRLSRPDAGCGRRQIQVVLRDRREKSQLLELHRAPCFKRDQNWWRNGHATPAAEGPQQAERESQRRTRSLAMRRSQ